MELLQYSLRKLLAGIPLILGVTLVSFALMVYFGPDLTYQLLGKNPTPEQILEVRHQLGYDQNFVQRYLVFLREIVTLDFGSASTGEPVSTLLADKIPVSLILILPGFVLGHVVGLLLALAAAYWRGRWPDKLIMALAVIGMSISFLIVIIAFQILLSSSDGLDLFPGARLERRLLRPVPDLRDRADAGHHVRGPGLRDPLLPVGRSSRK